MKSLILALTLVGCTFPHVEPQLRAQDTQERAAIRIHTSCSEASPFKTGEPGDPHAGDPDIVWYPDGWATGVIISEHYALTAAHAVRCPIIPDVVATLVDGRWFTMNVKKDDAMFGEGADIALLEIASADQFHEDIAPPKLGHAIVNDPAIGALFRHDVYGSFDGSNQLTLRTRPGDSGAGVYNLAGELVGLVVAGDGAYTTRYVPVTARWLEGT